MSPGVYLRWLPVWLPGSGSPVVTGLHISSLAASASVASRIMPPLAVSAISRTGATWTRDQAMQQAFRAEMDEPRS